MTCVVIYPDGNKENALHFALFNAESGKPLLSSVAINQAILKTLYFAHELKNRGNIVFDKNNNVRSYETLEPNISNTLRGSLVLISQATKSELTELDASVKEAFRTDVG